MDYKEKYNNLLGRLKALVSVQPEVTKGCFLKQFPELKESEDERIRKSLLAYLKGESKKLDTKKWIDWLERQGEQKPVEDQQKEIDYAYRRGLADCRKAFNTEPSETDFIRKEIYDIIAALPLSDKRTGMLLWLESQKLNTATNKQKPVEPTDLRTWKYIVDDVLTEREGIGQYIDTPWTTEVAEKLQKRFGNIEQKPVEAKPHLPDGSIPYDRGFEEAQEYLSKRGFDVPWNDCDVYVDERHITQTVANVLTWADEHPKQKFEWSEEDEHRIKDTIYFLETAKKHYASTIELDACIDWLKSLRPQSQWKPTEEQMDELKYAYIHKPYSSEVLETLYDDLKKLMEE